MGDIVSTDWLAEHLGAPEMRILDTRMSFGAYELNHIPGAQFLHIETLRMTERGMPCKMMPVSLLQAIFGRLGIAVDTPVVIHAGNPQDILSATYTAWSLAVTGNTNVHLLDGGLDKWVAEERDLTQEYPKVAEADYAGHYDDAVCADWQYIFDHLDDPEVALVDTRTRDAYAGIAGTTQRLGHIPTAILHNYLWDFHQDGTYWPADRLRARYIQAGITPEKEIITYCDTGREGSAAWFTLKYILGYPRVRLYQTGMTEWASHPELPLVLGVTPETGEEGLGQEAA